MLKTLFFSIFIFFHPVHVTLTSIDYIPEKNSFSVFIRLYKDDFLTDFGLKGQISVSDFSDDSPSSFNIMEKYITEKVHILVNGKRLTCKLKSMNLDDNEISVNLEYATAKNIKSVTVRNLIMTDLYQDQANMIIVKVNKFEEGVKLSSDLSEKTFILN